MKKKSVSLIITILTIGLTSYGQVQIGNDIDGENPGDLSGHSVAISANGNIVAIGAIENSDGGSRSGHVRVYENVDGTWTQIGEDIEGENFQDISATSISLSNDGSIIAIGAPRSDGTANNSGHVRVFENSGGSWIQIGQDIDGVQEQGRLGNSVALNGEGNIIAIGASQNDENGTNTGKVKVFENINGAWTQLGGDINGEVEFEDSGSEVALSQVGNIVAISSPSSNANGLHSGHVRIFEYVGGVWTQIGEDINGEASEDYFGWSIALSASGNVIAIGSLWNDNNGSDAGNVRVFQNLGGAWTQMGLSINGEAANDNSGFSVDISDDGSIVAIGAKANDGNGDFSGHVRVFDLTQSVLSIPTIDLETTLSLFPNPSRDVLKIHLEEDQLEKIELYSVSGGLILKTVLNSNTFILNTANYPSGTYLLKIFSQNHGFINTQFIKE